MASRSSEPRQFWESRHLHSTKNTPTMQAGKRKREVSSCIPCYTRKQKVPHMFSYLYLPASP